MAAEHWERRFGRAVGRFQVRSGPFPNPDTVYSLWSSALLVTCTRTGNNYIQHKYTVCPYSTPIDSRLTLFFSDHSAGKMIFGIENIDPERRARLIELLDIDVEWSMMTVSDGQRRRVQICMGLLKPFKVLLCDEITVDLDILGRLDLLQFLREECEQRGATVVYATHIFDGMEQWMTHIAFASNGELKYGGAKDSIPGLKGVRHLLSTIDQWLRVDRDERRAREAKQALEPPKPKGLESRFQNRHMAYYS